MLGARLPATVSEIADFAAVVLIVAGGLFVAVAMSKLSAWFPFPDRRSSSSPRPSPATSSRPGGRLDRNGDALGAVALIIILFEGGMDVGWRRFRRSWHEITVLGVVGTFGTALLIALFAHAALDVSWTLAAILGAALSPCDA